MQSTLALLFEQRHLLFRAISGIIKTQKYKKQFLTKILNLCKKTHISPLVSDTS